MERTLFWNGDLNKLWISLHASVCGWSGCGSIELTGLQLHVPKIPWRIQILRPRHKFWRDQRVGYWKWRSQYDSRWRVNSDRAAVRVLWSGKITHNTTKVMYYAVLKERSPVALKLPKAPSSGTGLKGLVGCPGSSALKMKIIGGKFIIIIINNNLKD